ncbi:MAG: putative porin [Elusimicrobiales bacterium]|nr:putative porin [Elusimicrobiales bacterium]
MKLKKNLLALLFLAAALPASAGELDILLDRLVAKNVLAPVEAQEIKAGAGPAAAMPAWAQTLKFRGDMRLRYQYTDNENKALTQHRARYRLRFGADAKANERVSASFGFASGSSADPRSTNQTFTDNFGKKNLYIDYAFVEYKASEKLSLNGGRIKNPLWLTNDMLWDTDINMEGVGARFNAALSHSCQFFANAGYMVLNELANSSHDPGLLFLQPGLSWHDTEGVYDLKAGAAVYGFNHQKRSSPLNYRPSLADGYQQVNTLAGGKYKYSYNAFSPEVELNANILKPLPVPLLGAFGWKLSYIGFFGNYVQAMDHGGDNKGGIGGVKLGQRKVEGAGQWQLRYSARRLGKDAWLETYPDSDFYGGSAGVKGQEALLALGLMKDFVLDLDYYSARPTSGSLKRERVFQADLNVRF